MFTIPLKPKPTMTAADYLVIAVGPILIMLLVGSLCFFLIEVFFRGEGVGGIRWVMFWFVMAVVLVSRIGIEQGTGQAAVYGLGLAAATWLYLVRIYPAFILGMILLGTVWWCAHKLTWDCTLLHEDEDASGSGLLQTVSAGRWKSLRSPKLSFRKTKSATPHPPGLWVVYFSLAALPLFGLGQVLLPHGDATARHAGFVYFLVYVAAAMGLLLSTSFLGLRRYLRQRYIAMPPMIALGWIRFGVGFGMFVLLGAMLLPRPGAEDAWQGLRKQVDYRIHQASNYALRFNPHGQGQGRTGEQSGARDANKTGTGTPPPQNSSGPGQSPAPDQNGTQSQQGAPSQSPASAADALVRTFKILFWVGILLFAAWWLYRRWELVAQTFKAMIEAITRFIRGLLGFNISIRRGNTVQPAKPMAAPPRPFAAFRNPFLSGREGSWTQRDLVLYSYDALRAWAVEKGFAPRADQTAREFCRELGGQFPGMEEALRHFSFLYAQAAYTTGAAENADMEAAKNLWGFFYQ